MQRVLICACLTGAFALGQTVWSGADVTFLGAPSPDGALLSFVDLRTGDLALRVLKTGETRRLTKKPAGSEEFAYFSVFSRDGKQVAYAWRNAKGFYDLRVVNVDGSGDRVVYSNEEAGFVQPTSWSPDGSRILTLLFRKDNISQVGFVSSKTGQVEVLKSLPWVYPKKMSLSPDGRYVAFDSFAGDKPGPRDIYVLDVVGKRQWQLVESPGEDRFPLWSDDGQAVFYLSDGALCRVPVSSGKAAGAAVVVKSGLERALPLGLTRANVLLYGLRRDETAIHLAAIGAPGESKLAGSTPALSWDGSMLAYLVPVGSENYGQPARALRVRSLRGEKDWELKTSMAHIEGMQWSPDLASLLLSGSDGKGRAGLFRVDVKDGSTAVVFVSETAGFRGVPGAWKSEHEVLYADGNTVLSHNLKTRGTREFWKGGVVRAIAVGEGAEVVALQVGTSVVLVGTGQKVAIGDGELLGAQGNGFYVRRGSKLFYLPKQGGTMTQILLDGYDGGRVSPALSGPLLTFTTGGIHNEVRMLPLK